MMRELRAALLLSAAGVLDAQEAPFLASPAERGVVLRWVWNDGSRPAGYFIDRRASSTSPWTRLTPRPITRIRDRGAARALVGEEFERYSGLLFPETPGSELADPETFRGMLLLSADLQPGVARVLGLRYDDSTAVAMSPYEYRLVELTASGERAVATSGAVIAGTYRTAAGPDGLGAVSGPRGSGLRWTAAPRFSGYHVYRGSRRDPSSARRLNTAPVIVFTRDDGSAMEASVTFFTDTAPPADSAFYFVRGIDVFGRLSAHSAPAAFVYRAPVVIVAPVMLQARTAGDTVVVSWQAPAQSRATRYQLWRADSSTGTFTRVGQPVRAPGLEQRDAGRPARRVTWYRVTAMDDAGNQSEPSALTLAEVPDREPPAPPDSLVGAADTGRVTLRWRQVAAPDLRGYRVYRASSAGGTYALLSVTPQREARFVDGIRTRADHPFLYRVTAVDSAFNESRPSGVVAVRPPDATAPSPPRIARTAKLDRGIVVTWLPNPEPDVVEYRPRFRARGETAWRMTSERIVATQLSDTITGLVAGQTYELTVFAVDDARNVSGAAPIVEASPAKPRALGRPEVRSAAFDVRQRAVVIAWSAPQGAREVLVLRRERGTSTLRVVGGGAAGETRFLDSGVRAGVDYEYVVRARDAFGNEADSGARRVTIPRSGS